MSSSEEILAGLLATQVEDGEALSTTELLPPERESVLLEVKELKLNSGEKQDGESSRVWARVDVSYIIRDEEISKYLNRDEPVIFGQGIMIGVITTPDGKWKLDLKNNSRLGKFLTILGVNITRGNFAGWLEDAKGRSVYGKISHTPRMTKESNYEEQELDMEGNPVFRAEVTAISPAS